MPTYEYECPKCGLTFEYFQSMTDEPLKTCIHPEGCKHKNARPKVTRLIGRGAGIIFKGSGFYETDYRSKEYREAAKKDNGKVAKKTDKPSSETGSAEGKTKTETKKEVKKE